LLGEQIFAGAEDVADGTALLTGHLAHQAVREHFREVDDGIERGA